MSKSQITNERRDKNIEKKRRRRFFIYFFGGLLAIIFILGLTISPALGSGTTSNKIKGNGVNLEGPVATDIEEKRRELGIGEPHQGYTISPPTSGAYWFDVERPIPGIGVTSPAPWGNYDTQLPNEVLVANLLHGGIGIHYDCSRIDPESVSIKSGGDICNELKDNLIDLMPESQFLFLMSPYSTDKYPIIITGWRHHLKLMEFDELKIIEFIEAYQDRAPLSSFRGN
jgi:hypothetical protein|tara:strand:- start:9130 stop:9813 length:684 start_codon:yes stop_codon:yes gene_type:complete